MKITISGAVTALLSITFIILAAICILLLQNKTAVEYDNGFVKDRNAIIEEVDKLTTTLGTAHEEEDVQAQLDTLTSLNKNFKDKLENDKTAEEFRELKTENVKFTAVVDRIITKGEEYENSFTDKNADVQKIIEDYNTIIAELDTQVKNIETKVKEAPKFNFI